MKTISKQVMRSKAAGNVLVLLRIEGLKASDAAVQAIHACRTCTDTTASVVKQVI